MVKITVKDNIFKKDGFTVETDNLPIFIEDYCRANYGKFPETAKLYQGRKNITPTNDEELKALSTITGDVEFIIFPQDPITTLIVSLVISVALSFLLTPAIPNAALQNNRNPSPNNELSRRTNRDRLGGRICDIFGTVYSIPDLIAVPYTRFEANVEYEVAAMCVGRGFYEIEDIRDGGTPIANISGTSVNVYDPETEISSTVNNAQITIGEHIAEPLYNVIEVNGVNGQTLLPPNYGIMFANITTDIHWDHATQGDFFLDINENVQSDEWTDGFTEGELMSITGHTLNVGNGTSYGFTDKTYTDIRFDAGGICHKSLTDDETFTRNTDVDVPVVITDSTNSLIIGTDFDGSTNYLDVLVLSLTDSKKFVFACSVVFDNAEGSSETIYRNGASARFYINRRADGDLWVLGRNSANVTILECRCTNALTSSGIYNIIVSCDLAVGIQIYVNDVNVTPTPLSFTNDTLSFNASQESSIGGDHNGASPLNGKLRFVYLFPNQTLDLSVEANRRKFFNASGVPANLGSNGSTPLGTQPPLFLMGGISDFYVNKGSLGGSFTVRGTLNNSTQSIDLDGTYAITTIADSDLTLTDPVSVNSDWEWVNFIQTTGTISGSDLLLDRSGESRTISLDGEYEIVSLDEERLYLLDPYLENTDWYYILWTSPVSGGHKISGSPFKAEAASQPRIIGEFFVDDPNMESVLCNVVAQGGLWKQGGAEILAEELTVQFNITPANINGVANGATETYQYTLKGNKQKNQVGISCEIIPSFGGRFLISCQNITDRDYDFEGTVQDEVKWRNLYSLKPYDDHIFPHITVIHSKSRATNGALRLKERRLTCQATRLIPQRVSGSTFTTELYPSNSVADIISFCLLDPYIGNRTVDEIDFDDIYDTEQEILDYFDNPDAATFNYSFDDDNLSVEEMLMTIAKACFSSVYREGSIIKMFFEKPQTNPLYLFNYRNKLPGTEKRTFTFGKPREYDGIELTYTSPVDGKKLQYYIPEDKSATNPKKEEIIGVNSREIAFYHAWRMWQKMQYQRLALQFTALEEGKLLIPNNKIRVTNGIENKSVILDGQIIEQNGTTLILDKDVDLSVGTYAIFLQLYNGTTESFTVTQGTAANQVVLSGSPSLALIGQDDEDENYKQTIYSIVKSTDVNDADFLVVEKSPKDGNFEFEIDAINYDARYYEYDNTYNVDIGEIPLLKYNDANYAVTPTGSAASGLFDERNLVALGQETVNTEAGNYQLDPALTVGDTTTITFWVYPFTIGSSELNNSIFRTSSAASSGNRIHIWVDYNGGAHLMKAISGATAATTQCEYAITPNVWSFWAVKFKATTTELYAMINGVVTLVDTQSNTGGFAYPLYVFGGSYSGNTLFNGNLFDARIYNTDKNTAELREISKQGKPNVIEIL